MPWLVTWAAPLLTCPSSGNPEPLRRTRGNLMGVWTALAMVDIVSVTAGGGSIGWADSMGFLRVGPRSAGRAAGTGLLWPWRDQSHC